MYSSSRVFKNTTEITEDVQMKKSRPIRLSPLLGIIYFVCFHPLVLKAQPDPEIVHFDIPSIWEMDNPDPVVIEISARNQGSWSNEGDISVSFPSLDSFEDCDNGVISIYPGCDDELGDYCYPHGETIHDCDCDEFEAQYLLYEGVDWDWNNDELNNYCLQYYPNEPGEFVIYFRTAAHDPDGGVCDYFRDPVSSNYTDQQGCPVYRHVVYITCQEDDYEEDNHPYQATLLQREEPQDHNICQIGDEDWYRIVPDISETVEIETSGENDDDTEMWLYDVNQNLLAYDDDSGDLWWSKITYDLEAGVTYLVRIQEWGDNDWIEHYQIEWRGLYGVSEGSLSTTPMLMPNYPNPFNPSTTISYSLAIPTNVTLKVYNIYGQQVATLVDNYNPAGIHTAEFDGSDLSSGCYLYVLEAEQSRKVRKMIILR